MIPYSVLLNKIIGIFTIICSLGWMYKCWNNGYLIILSMFITYSNYSIVMGIYLDESLRPRALYPQITDLETYSIGIFLLFLTMLSLMILSPKCKKNNVKVAKEFIKSSNKNDIMFLILVIAFLSIVIFGYTRQENSRGTLTTIYEYASILMIYMFYFSGNCKYQKNICAFCCSIYALTSLLNGTRIEALMCILVFVLCYFENELDPKILLLVMSIGLCIFSIIGNVRGNWLLMKGNLNEFGSVLLKNKLVFDTCTHAYFPMICMINLYKDYSFPVAMNYLVRFILTIFIGSNRVVDGNLSRVVRTSFVHNHGGVSQGFFFVWFSYAGVLIFSFIILAYMGLINNEKTVLTPTKCCAIIYIVSSVPRWYLYGPWSLFRGVLICIIFFKIFTYLGRITQK